MRLLFVVALLLLCLIPSDAMLKRFFGDKKVKESDTGTAPVKSSHKKEKGHTKDEQVTSPTTISGLKEKKEVKKEKKSAAASTGSLLRAATPQNHPEANRFYKNYFDMGRQYKGTTYDYYKPQGKQKQQTKPVFDAGNAAFKLAKKGQNHAISAVLSQCAFKVTTAMNMHTASAFYVPIIEAALYNGGAKLSAAAKLQITTLERYLFDGAEPFGHLELHGVEASALAALAQESCASLVKKIVDQMVLDQFWNNADYQVPTPSLAEEKQIVDDSEDELDLGGGFADHHDERGHATATTPREEDVAAITSMGFSPEQAKAALKHNGGNVEHAINYLLGQ